MRRADTERLTGHRARGIIPRTEGACSHRSQGNSPELINHIPDGGQRDVPNDARKVVNVIDRFCPYVGFCKLRGRARPYL
jgi:hypothetical protein